MTVPEMIVSGRFFFHLICNGEVIRDEKGINLATEEDGIPICAAQAIQELRQEGFFTSGRWQGWQMEVTDCAGRTVLSFPLGDPHLDRSPCYTH
jgi:hypothetical protein